MVLVMREERPSVGVVTCEDREEQKWEEGVTLPEGEMGAGGREVGALSVFLFLLELLSEPLLQNFLTDGTTSSDGEREGGKVGGRERRKEREGCDVCSIML